MSKPDERQKTPAEEWAEFNDRLRGLLSRSAALAQKFYPQRLSDETIAAEGRQMRALFEAGEQFLADLREFYARVNGKLPAATTPKETKK